MAEKDTVLIVVSIAAIALMGFLYFKVSQQQTEISLRPKTNITEFVRDKDGRIIQILERG